MLLVTFTMSVSRNREEQIQSTEEAGEKEAENVRDSDDGGEIEMEGSKVKSGARKCDVCELINRQAQKGLENQLEHVRAHENSYRKNSYRENSYRENSYTKVVKLLVGFQDHMRNVHGQDKLKCLEDNCGATFSLRCDYKSHWRIHHSQGKD